MKTAKRGIPVKKMLTAEMFSPFFAYKWGNNEVHKLNCKLYVQHHWGTGWDIEIGFHSCKNMYKVCHGKRIFLASQPVYHTFNIALNFSVSLDSPRAERLNFRVYDAVIPKGANYYLNEYGDYVSDQLMIKGLSRTPLETIKC